MSNLVRRAAGTHLSDQELQELRNLAKMPDDGIDCSDIPEQTSLKRKTKAKELATNGVSSSASMSKAS